MAKKHSNLEAYEHAERQARTSAYLWLRLRETELELAQEKAKNEQLSERLEASRDALDELQAKLRELSEALARAKASEQLEGAVAVGAGC